MDANERRRGISCKLGAVMSPKNPCANDANFNRACQYTTPSDVSRSKDAPPLHATLTNHILTCVALKKTPSCKEGGSLYVSSYFKSLKDGLY